MVNDVRPLVQVVYVIAAVIATVTEHQLQHQVLWRVKKDSLKVTEVNTMATGMLRASHYSIIASSSSSERLSG